MEIKIIQSENSDGMLCEDMEINGNFAQSVYPLNERPEDAYLERDLISCSAIADYMKEAYEAGKNGESFDVQVVQEKDCTD